MALKIKKAAVLGRSHGGTDCSAIGCSWGRTHLLDLSSDQAPEDPKLKKLLVKLTVQPLRYWLSLG